MWLLPRYKVVICVSAPPTHASLRHWMSFAPMLRSHKFSVTRSGCPQIHAPGITKGERRRTTSFRNRTPAACKQRRSRRANDGTAAASASTGTRSTTSSGNRDHVQSASAHGIFRNETGPEFKQANKQPSKQVGYLSSRPEFAVANLEYVSTFCPMYHETRWNVSKPNAYERSSNLESV